MEELLRESLFRLLGPGLLIPFLLLLTLWFLWSEREHLIALLQLWRMPLPRANRDHFAVAIAHLENDPDHQFERDIFDHLHDLRGPMEVLNFDRVIPLGVSQDERQEKDGHRRARLYLRNSGADLLIWGVVVSPNLQQARLYYTPRAGRGTRSSRRHQLGERLPELIWGDLVTVICLVIATEIGELIEEADYLPADEVRPWLKEILEPFISKARSLAKANPFKSDRSNDSHRKLAVVIAKAVVLRAELVDDGESWKQAVEICSQALEECALNTGTSVWLQAQLLLGRALLNLGVRETGIELLEKARAAFREVLGICSARNDRQSWLMAQRGSAAVLLRIGEDGWQSADLEQAASICRDALKNLNGDGARFRADLLEVRGCALARLGERESRVDHLKQAIAAHRTVLKFRDPDRNSRKWAGSQGSLGNALMLLGVRITDWPSGPLFRPLRGTLEYLSPSGVTLLRDSVSAYNEALSVLTQDGAPSLWRMIQLNLGASLYELAQRTVERDHKSDLLRQSISALRGSLLALTPMTAFREWASAEVDLANSLALLGIVEDGVERLDEAVAIVRRDLKILSAEREPFLWTRSQQVLCFALVNIARQQSPTQGSEAIWNLEAAVDVALALLSGSIPQIVGAQVQLILSGALLFLGMLKKDAALLEEALETSIAVWLLLSGLGHPLANRAKPITATAVRTLTEILQPAEYQGIFGKHAAVLLRMRIAPKAPGNVAI